MEFVFDKDRFYMGPDQEHPLAQITFVQNGDALTVDHTFTDPSLRGQGIARKLVEQVAAYARENAYKVRATCPYAAKVLAEPEFADIYQE